MTSLPPTAQDTLRRQLDDAKDDFLFERKQVVALREVLTEMFNCLATGDPALLFDDEQIDEWRERSGMTE